MGEADFFAIFLCLAFILCNLSLAVEDQESTCEGPECDEEFQKQWRLPLRVDGVKVGHEREVEIFPGTSTVIRTLSMRPLVFEIPNFITIEECDHLISYAKTLGLERSPLLRDPENIDDETSQRTFDIWDYNDDGFISPIEVTYLPGKRDLYFTKEDILEMFKELEMDSDGNELIDFEEFKRTTVPAMKAYFKKLKKNVPRMRSRNSDQAWMFHDDARYPLLADFHGRLSQLTLLPKEIIRNSEPVQAVKYEVHGHYHCHQDSDELDSKLPCCTMAVEENCRLCRYMTVLMFLNNPQDGGETAFPVANNETFSHEKWRLQETSEKCNLATQCDKSNLRVTPESGKAIMWYNHFRDSETGWLGDLDPMTYHGGCDVITGTKWIANIWLNIAGKPGTREAFQGWRHLYEKKRKKSVQQEKKEDGQEKKPNKEEAYDVKEEL